MHKSDMAPFNNSSKMKIKRGVNFKLKNPKNENMHTLNDELKLDALDSNRIFNN